MPQSHHPPWPHCRRKGDPGRESPTGRWGRGGVPRTLNRESGSQIVAKVEAALRAH
jgi:hypothetical protein